MKLTDFDYHLPANLIARFPLPERSASRLLCLNQQGMVSHDYFQQVLELLQPNDLLVFNDTKVIPARLMGRKTTGGQVEVFVERILDDRRFLGLLRASKPPHVGDSLLFDQGVALEISQRQEVFYEFSYHDDHRPVLEVIETIGQIPLPPYLDREPKESDKERYQTIYARHKGSVAAPTAGLHFDEVLLEKIKEKGVQCGYVTLHVGAGTFMPVRAEAIQEHKMHTEYLDVPEVLCEQMQKTRAAGGRIVAVGTTTVRALETACQAGDFTPYRGETSIFLYPGYQFRCVDALITNLHLPRSTLLMLVCAFGGYEPVMRAYHEAVRAHYRFFSYGDAMWVERG